MPSQSFGHIVRRVRIALGLSQQQLANFAGLSQATISSLESSADVPTAIKTRDALYLALRSRALDRADLRDDMAELSQHVGPVTLLTARSKPPLAPLTAMSPPFYADSRPDFAHTVDEVFSQPAVPLASILREDWPLYVPTRRHGSLSNDKAFAYELALLQPLTETTHKHTTILVGPAGTGKTTLIYSFLRGTCTELPNYKETFIECYVPFDDSPTISDANRLFDLHFRQALTRIGVHRHDGGAMFADYVTLSPESRSDWSAIRAVHISMSNDLWINSALDYLRNVQSAFDKTILLCLDNLDLCPMEVARHIFVRIRSLLATLSPSVVTHVYIPLRPATYDKFNSPDSNARVDLSTARVIHTGNVDSHSVLERRLNVASTKMSANTRLEATPYFDAVLSSLSRISSDSDLSESNEAGTLISQLTAGNLRLERDIWNNILSNRTLHESYRLVKHIKAYDLITAMLSGPIANSAIPLIPNVFCTDSGIGRFSPLVGVHMLSALTSHKHWQTLVPAMVAAGHDENSIIATMQYFCDTTLFGEVADRGPIEFQPEKVHALHSLFVLPAYLDHMAMTTPLPDELRKIGAVTTGFDRNDFQARVDTTLQFLTYLASVEYEYLSVNPSAVSNVASLCIKAYRERLVGLQKSNRLSDIIRSHGWEHWFARLDAL